MKNFFYIYLFVLSLVLCSLEICEISTTKDTQIIQYLPLNTTTQTSTCKAGEVIFHTNTSTISSGKFLRVSVQYTGYGGDMAGVCDPQFLEVIIGENFYSLGYENMTRYRDVNITFSLVSSATNIDTSQLGKDTNFDVFVILRENTGYCYASFSFKYTMETNSSPGGETPTILGLPAWLLWTLVAIAGK